MRLGLRITPLGYYGPLLRLYSTQVYHKDTIYALSSGAGRSAIALIRLSGSAASTAIKALTQKHVLPTPRVATIQSIYHPTTNELLDKAMILWFPAPRSYTAEDVAELHIHGGPSVIADTLSALGSLRNTRAADPGEFTKRAFNNGKLDLTEVEGLSDLLSAQTQAQRTQALLQMQGALGGLYKRWRDNLITSMAYMEALIDFSEDQGIDTDIIDEARKRVTMVTEEIALHLKDGNRGEKLRDGAQAVIIGPPNAGKSSLMNILAKRKVSIVSPIPGTTRDVVETMLDIGGFPVIVGDTAGLREATDVVEQMGIDLTRERVAKADIKIAVFDSHEGVNCLDPRTLSLLDANSLVVLNKCDDLTDGANTPNEILFQNFKRVVHISCKTGHGISTLLIEIEDYLRSFFGNVNRTEPILTRARHRDHLVSSVGALQAFLDSTDVVMAAEHLRLAIRAISAITGEINTEMILEKIFKDFCIGK